MKSRSRQGLWNRNLHKTLVAQRHVNFAICMQNPVLYSCWIADVVSLVLLRVYKWS